MKRLVIIGLVVACALSMAIYVGMATPTTDVVLETGDGQGSVTYRCATGRDDDPAQRRAEAAHVFYQDQLQVIGEAVANGMQTEMDAADAAGTSPDFSAIEAVKADLLAATMTVVDDLYGCRVM